MHWKKPASRLLASSIPAAPKEVVFTSGGTESVNHAIKGVALAKAEKGKHIVTSNIEHNAVLRSLRRLKMMDYQVTSVPVDNSGRVNPLDVAKAIQDDTVLVTIMHSNNEIGTIQPIEEIAKITREKKVLFHTDAVDSVGVVPDGCAKTRGRSSELRVQYILRTPGRGRSVYPEGDSIWPLLDGGVQENNKRAGTENLIGIIGTGVAADLALRDMDKRIAHAKNLKEMLLRELPNYIDGVHPQWASRIEPSSPRIHIHQVCRRGKCGPDAGR